jgi:hypothetical protein
MQNDGNVWNYYGTLFRPGDKVRVVRIEEDEAPNGMGEGTIWHNSWPSEMDRAVGLVFEIDDIDEQGVHFAEPEHSPITWYAYPLSALEKI